MTQLRRRRPEAAGFRFVPPRDGGWTLAPMENFLRGLRDPRSRFALEIYAQRGAVSFAVRAYDRNLTKSTLESYYPQGHVELLDVRQRDRSADWLRLDHGEFATVMPVWLGGDGWLPLATPEDNVLERERNDPLTGLFGVLSAETREPAHRDQTRIGVRLIIQPASPNWGRTYQNRLQARIDGDDRKGRDEEEEGSGLYKLLIPAAGAVTLLGLNYAWFSSGDVLRALGVDLLAGIAGVGGYYLWRKMGLARARPYLDEKRLMEKLKGPGFQTEIQLVYIDRDQDNDTEEAEVLERLSTRLRQFDDAAGNRWRNGKVRKYAGDSVNVDDAGLGEPGMTLDWVNRRRAQGSILSPKEVATLWHPPLGDEDMVPMERGGAAVKAPFLRGLDHGAMVGHTEDGRQRVLIPPDVLSAHGLILGSSGVGKSTLALQLIADFIDAKARGENDDSLFVLDPHGDLARDTLDLVPDSIAHKVKYIDLAHEKYVPALNLLDPRIFPQRDRCVDTIVATFRALSEGSWGNRVSELLSNSLKMLYEANREAVSREAYGELLTVLDVVRLIGDGTSESRGGVEKMTVTKFQSDVRRRVNDFHLQRWFDQIMNWGQRQRNEAFPPVLNRIGKYLMDEKARVVMGQRESTLVVDDLLENGDMLIINTAQSEIGEEPAAVVGGTMVSLMHSALLAQGKMEESERSKCLMVVDEFQTIMGAPWELIMSEVRKYGGRLLLITQGLSRLATQERNLKEGVLANLGFIAAYRLGGDDASILSRQLVGGPELQADLVKLHPHTCYMKVTSDGRTLPVFTLHTLPPPRLAEGSAPGKERVFALMPAYSVDHEEALRRMAAEVAQDNVLAKLGAPVGQGVKPDTYDQLLAMGGTKSAALPKALKGIPEEDIEGSEYAPEFLAKVVQDANTDRGLGGALDKANRGRTRSVANRAVEAALAAMSASGGVGAGSGSDGLPVAESPVANDGPVSASESESALVSNAGPASNAGPESALESESAALADEAPDLSKLIVPRAARTTERHRRPRRGSE